MGIKKGARKKANATSSSLKILTSLFPLVVPDIGRGQPSAQEDRTDQCLMRILHNKFPVRTDEKTDVGKDRHPYTRT